MSGHIAGAWILRERVPKELRTNEPARARRRHAATGRPGPPHSPVPAQRRPRGATLLQTLGDAGATVRAALRAAVTRSRAGRHAPGRATTVG